MAFDFYAVYALSAPEFKPEIVLGVHQGTAAIQIGTEAEVIWFLLTHGSHRAHYLEGALEEHEDGHAVVDAANGPFLFEPLTLEHWQQLGTEGHIVGFDELSDRFHSDEELQQFYLHEFLDEVYLKWVDLHAGLPNQ